MCALLALVRRDRPAHFSGGGVWLLLPGTGPRWVGMWLLALGLYTGCKGLTLVRSTCRAGLARRLGYLIAWPGMNADGFLCDERAVAAPSLSELWFALSKVALGVLLVWGLVPRLAEDSLVRDCVGMIGLVFVLHFGLFHVLSWLWRHCGVDAPPIMDWPILARSVADFWGRRWNTAFRELTHRFLFQPLARRWGVTTALMLGFFASGLIHEAVITVPAEAGWGGPTLYFVLQGTAILLERSRIGKRLGLGHGWRGRGFAAVVLVTPVALLFPPAFVRAIVGPTLVFLTGGGHA